eukprot:scaffold7708_cov122-Amphora_coffeaeformis.AAC.2
MENNGRSGPHHKSNSQSDDITEFCILDATAKDLEEDVLDLDVATISRIGSFCSSAGLPKPLAKMKKRDSERACSMGEIIRYMEGTGPLWRDNDTWLAPPLGICPFLRAQNA